MPRKTKATFRFCRKTIGLTYSCPTDKPDNPIQDHEQLLKLIQDRGPCLYIIGKEYQKDGKVHWHLYVKWESLVESTSPHFMDLAGVHPNVLKDKPGKGWIEYCTKDKDYITNFYEANPFTEALSMPNSDDAIEYLWVKQPRLMITQAHHIIQNIRNRFTPVAKYPLFMGPYPLSFMYPVNGWNPSTHALLVFGEPGIGKTNFARYLLACIGYPEIDYIKGTLQRLKTCRFNKAILFDEIYMNDVDPNMSREITDIPNGGSIKLRYNDVIIPPGIPRVFCSNYERPFRNPQSAVYDHRVKSVNLKGPNLRFAY